MGFEVGQRVRIPGKDLPEWVTVDFAQAVGSSWKLYVKDDGGTFHPVELTETEAGRVSVITDDGGADSARVLAGMWTQWMQAATANAHATVLASTPLRPYAHQSNAVYGAMLPQPLLRFLLADEPGTGKTVMAGLYLREMQKLGFIRRALVVAPAGLVTKWQADFARFFGGELRRITNETIQQHGLAAPHDMWVVSLELAAGNPAVQEAVRPDRAGWDIVVFDEAHRLTPTAVTFHQLGRLLTSDSPRALLMTATPHRGSEWLFRHLLHLVDPDVYPDPGDDPKADLQQVRPGPVHFLRRMKEDLVDYDGRTPLFRGRTARNEIVPLNSVEQPFYDEALGLVDAYFPATAAPLARMVYGKRAASSLYALAETLRRRRDSEGAESPAEAARRADPYDEDLAAQDEAKVIAMASKAARAEKKAISDVLGRLEPLLASDSLPVSKWRPLMEDCLAANGITPGNNDQAVIFTEYADTADWIVRRLRSEGFTAKRYSGRDNPATRDEVRAEFMARKFQVIVSTDAGNEGIDLQSAHVLVNYDIPWSLVRLEQRMGRIHRVGQTRDVELFNLIAQGTREGDVMQVLLENFVSAANQMRGQMFDSLSLVAELSGLKEEELAGILADTYAGDESRRAAALLAVRAISAARLQAAAEQARRDEAALASTVDVAAAIQRLNADTLERINPAIVEAYLARLSDASVVDISKTAAGEGILRLSAVQGSLPPAFGGRGRKTALIATSGSAVTDAQASGAVIGNVVPLGPGEPAFTEMIAYAQHHLSQDVFRGGMAADPTAIDDYDLFAFGGSLVESDGQRTTPWATLIRVDATGARTVAWETLANLVPATGAAGRAHPAHLLDAQARAELLASEETDKRREAMRAWLTKADRDIRDLPSKISRDIKDRAERTRMRTELQETVRQRLDGLRRMSYVTISDIQPTARLRIRATGVPPDPTEKDSEVIAMRRTRDHLKADGWAVSDVHTEDRGYDLYATRGQAQRCVEVKGVWKSASAAGVSLTGNEILIATQQRSDYWLYVVDHCSDRKGDIYGVYRDPVATFEGLIKQEPVFKIPGSALKAARQKAMPA
jgi:superfamily II DNA or RNA helicase